MDEERGMAHLRLELMWTLQPNSKGCAMENESEKCPDVDELMKHYVLPVGYSMVFIGGLVGNSVALLVYVFKFRPWKSSSIIMVNLSVTDLLYALSMPYLIYYYSNGDQWELCEFMCRFMRFMFHFHLYASILFLACIALFRYVVVAWPLWAPRVQQKVWGITASVVVDFCCSSDAPDVSSPVICPEYTPLFVGCQSKFYTVYTDHIALARN